MAETRLLDFSSARPTVAQIRAAGAVGVIRYLCHSSGAKRLTKAEAVSLRTAGLQVGVVFEDSATRARAGVSAGFDDAVFAQKLAAAIGVPTSCPIFFAVDTDASAAQVRDYFAGIKSAGLKHPVGVYGGFAVVEGIVSAELARYGWQTGAWSHGDVSAHAHVYQRIQAKHPVSGTDENVLLRHVPFWGAPVPVSPVTPPHISPTPVPAPAPAPITEDPDMAVIAQVKGTLAQYVWNGLQKRHITNEAELADVKQLGLKHVFVSQATLDATPDLTIEHAK